MCRNPRKWTNAASACVDVVRAGKLRAIKRLPGVLFLAGLLAACSHNYRANPDRLVGIWGESVNQQTYPLLKVEQSNGRYVLYTHADGRWYRESDYVKIATKADLERLLHHPVQAPVTGLQASIVSIFEVPKGWTDGTFSTRTGYFAATWFGPVELVRLPG